MTWLTALSPEDESAHTEAEDVGWLERAGFGRTEAIEEPRVGVREKAPRDDLPTP